VPDGLALKDRFEQKHADDIKSLRPPDLELLPMIPHGATRVNDLISVVRQDDHWTYFCGVLPMLQHPQDGRRSFRMFTAQLCCQGACTQAQIIRTFGVSKNYDTLRKAINQGRIQQSARVSAEESSVPPPSSHLSVAASDKSTRSDADAAAGDEMGIGCTRPCERVMAAIGLLPGGATIQFQFCRDVSYGGVLCALPALGENGLFRHLATLPVRENQTV